MKIENLRSEQQDGRARILATVRWEETDRPTQEVFFETDKKFADRLSCNPHAFLVGSVVPALRHGEKRIFVDAEICPELRDNLITALSWIRHWYYPPDQELLQIEAKTLSVMPSPSTSREAALFFSGGVDSLATLRSNRLNYPPDHPGSIRHGLLIYGQNIESDNRPETFEKAVTALSGVAHDAGITLIPIYTNVRGLDEEGRFFCDQFHGSILGAAAHAFARRLGIVFVSATDDIPSLILQGTSSSRPWGSHPLLDPNFSSSDLQIRHDGVHLSRLTKTKLVADWDIALQSIKVCAPNYPGANCGKCEKCIRTELALLALGVLDKTDAFPLNDLSEDLVTSVSLKPATDQHWTPHHQYLELISPLKRIGRHDLARAIEQMIARSNGNKTGWKAKAVKFDQKHLNGNVAKFKRMIFS